MLSQKTWLELEASTARWSADGLVFDGEVELATEGWQLTASAVTVSPSPLEQRIEAQQVSLRYAHSDIQLLAESLDIASDRLTGAAVSVVDLDGTVLAEVEHLTLGAGGLVLEGVSIAACPCEGDSVVHIHADRVVPDANGATLTGVQVSLWTLPINVPVHEVAEDGRQSGLLFPELGYGSELGFWASLPVFVRLGAHADLTPAVGWATEIGPTARLRYRHDLGAGSKGDWSGRFRYHLDDEIPELELVGSGAVTGLERARATLRLDILSNVGHHGRARRGLFERAARAGRSTLALGWEGDQLELVAQADVFQSRPRRTGAAMPRGFDPFPDDVEAVHRLPRIQARFSQWLMPWLRVDLDARYQHTASLAGRLPADDALFTDLDAVGFVAGLSAPFDLGGFAFLAPAIVLEQRYLVAERLDGRSAFSRVTTLDAAVELGTSLVRPGTVAHTLRPLVRWSSRLAAASEDRIGGTTVLDVAEPVGIGHAVEAGVEASWFGLGWSLRLEATSSILAEAGYEACDTCVLGHLYGQLALPERMLTLVSHATWRFADVASPQALLGVEWRRSGGWHGALMYHHIPATMFASGRPAGGLATSWRRLRAETIDFLAEENLATDLVDLSFGHRGPGMDVFLGSSLVFEEVLGVEARAGLGYTGDCGCWRAGVYSERHITAPEWDLGLTLELLPGVADF